VVTDRAEIRQIIGKCDVCRLAMFDGAHPYLVPLNFGAAEEAGALVLYFHGRQEGKKMALLRANPHVAFEMDCGHRLVPGEQACSYTMEYESVCGTGLVEEVPDGGEKEAALRVVMRQYAPEGSFSFSEEQIRRVAVLRLTVGAVSGKRLRV
ncbi:MAG: pyridoxamine 5'-phosphate oxidase family protein, partial [Oscillospiraceae bacterium]|jgi:nitroimidazol reductase NimA-like FMN-containing flavoprotein (pyridoxamine 5'-phosphate oxidase superfamily)|nr:pyridoxamine 5'-phosphate oxidase family protein [Oscillospiraceae bacterium]